MILWFSRSFRLGFFLAVRRYCRAPCYGKSRGNSTSQIPCSAASEEKIEGPHEIQSRGRGALTDDEGGATKDEDVAEHAENPTKPESHKRAKAKPTNDPATARTPNCKKTMFANSRT